LTRKLWALGLSVVSALGVVPPVGLLALVSRSKAPAPSATAVLIAGERRYELEVATSAAQQQLGLGGRASLPATRGMLFVFSSSAEHCFWMKGMQFALDIIWLKADDKVVSVEAHLLPKSYPSAYCAVSEDVVELNAGQAQAAGIAVGRAVKLDMPRA
jgi:uncharacterized membrane protein (UPF0127 family)